MDLFDTTQLALERAMSGASLRHEALSANIANVNTPGYRRRDVDFHSTLRDALSATQPKPIESVSFSEQVDGRALRADGNGVDIDVENAELAKNGLEYEALVQAARGRTAILRAAMGVG